MAATVAMICSISASCRAGSVRTITARPLEKLSVSVRVDRCIKGAVPRRSASSSSMASSSGSRPPEASMP